MAACSKYVTRLRQAFKYRKIKFPSEIIDLMGKRAKTDRSIDDIIHGVLKIIEPTNCQKSHCPHHTSYSFCGCSKELVPGHCSLNLAYLKGRREREEAEFKKRLVLVPKKYLPLSPENENKIRTMDKYTWAEESRKWS